MSRSKEEIMKEVEEIGKRNNGVIPKNDQDRLRVEVAGKCFNALGEMVLAQMKLQERLKKARSKKEITTK